MTITELREVAENIESRYTEAEKKVSRRGFEQGMFSYKNQNAADLLIFLKFAYDDLIPHYENKRFQYTKTFRVQKQIVAVSRKLQWRNNQWESRVEVLYLTQGMQPIMDVYESAMKANGNRLEYFEKEARSLDEVEFADLLSKIARAYKSVSKQIDKCLVR